MDLISGTIRIMKHLSSLLLFFTAALSLATAAPKPNIIWIMSDDMGYSDIGCYGSEVATPVLDGLAAKGLRYTQFYNTARCCPTRASLLTGLYPHQAGIGHMMNDLGHDGYRGDLNRQCRTVAEVLKPAGYRSYICGKWHVTKQTAPTGPKHNWPLQRGFDRFYGTIHGAGSLWDPNSLTRGNTQISPFADPDYTPEREWFYTDAISDHAVRFITEHKQEHADQPFFCYVSYTAAHWPMHAHESDIAKYKGRYDEGYAPLRAERFARMKELGVIAADTELSPAAETWETQKYKAWDARNMEVYAAMVDNMDQGIGKIVQALKDSGQYENTLVMFFQDNGGCAENYGRGGAEHPRADQPTLPPMAAGALQTDMQPKQTRDGYPVRTGPNVMAGPADTYIGYGRGWANVSNTPFREYKHWVHEGGISTPLIAHWPAGIRRHGELESQPAHLIDLLATAVDLSDAPYPSEVDGEKITPLEGTSLAPSFEAKDIGRTQPLFWEHEGNRAVRVGDWKLVARGANGPWELYDIAADRAELHNKAAEMPAKVKEMTGIWMAWAERAHVLPLTPGRKKKARVNKKNVFKTAQGVELSGDAAPTIQAKALGFSAHVTAGGEGKQDGVIVAQGGSTHGYALYVTDGKIAFATRRNNELKVVQGPAMPVGPGKVSFDLAPDGHVEISLDGKVVAEGDAGGTMVAQPGEGYSVGMDSKGTVGTYREPFEFGGKVDKPVLTIR